MPVTGHSGRCGSRRNGQKSDVCSAEWDVTAVGINVPNDLGSMLPKLIPK